MDVLIRTGAFKCSVVALMLMCAVPGARAAGQVEPAVDSAVRAQAKAYEAAFDKHDAAAVAQLWTRDA
ncbi:MAG: hypothetical protein ACREJM_03415, partial [Candidatus Saccharimonadales bacterium]